MPQTAVTFDVNYPHPPNLLPIWERLPVHTGYGGKGITIAFIDSGFAPHPDVAARISRYVDASSRRVLEYRSVNQVDVFSWHGQMTTFVAASNGNTSGGRYRGIAHEADLMAVRITSKTGTVREHDILRGLEWLCHRHEQMGVRVVNISVGGDFPSQDRHHALHRAVHELVQDGVIVVVAAGNSGDNQLLPPASASGALVVGGYDDQNTTDRAEWFGYNNSYGTDLDGQTKPDLIAPAAWLPSPVMADSDMARDAEWLAPLLYAEDTSEALAAIIAEGYEAMHMTGDPALLPPYRVKRMVQERISKHKLVDQHHQHVDGTSVAAPIVSAVVAQMLEANPSLTGAQVRRILKDTASPLSGVPLKRQGAGVINPALAVETARELA